MAGEYLHIRPLDQYDGAVPLSSFASQSTDAIYLPESLPGERPGDYRVLAMQQVAQRLFGTYRFRLDPLLAAGAHFGDQATPELLAEPQRRLGDLARLRQCYRLPSLFQALFEHFEALRLTLQTLRRFPGLRRHYLALARASALSRLPAQELFPEGFPVAIDFDAATALTVACTGLFEQLASAQAHWLTNTVLPPIALQDERLDLDVLALPDADVGTSVRAADRCYLLLTAPLKLSRLPLPTVRPAAERSETSADWLERKVRLEDWEQEQASLETLLMNAELLDPSDVDAAESDGLAGDLKPEGVNLKRVAKEASAIDPELLSRRLAMERSALRHALGDVYGNTRSYRYDEWDCVEASYRRSWCCLYEQDLMPDPEIDGQALAERVRPWRDEIRTRLSQIKPLGYLRQRGLADGDELDFNAVLDARLDAAAGLTPDDRVYSRKDRLQRDLCCAFLIDLSASTDDPLEAPSFEADEDADGANLRDPYDVEFEPPPSEPARRIIDVQREAMLAMAAALESLGDEYGIYGFSGYGRDCVEYYVAKAIGAPFTPRSLHTIAAMKPRRSTRMGPAIRHTTQKLLASGHAMKLMIMLSDGFPQDSDYGPVRGDHEYGVMDTARAIEEAEAVGVRTFCITVDRSGHDYLSRMCPAEQYLVIDEIEALPAALSKIYARLAS